MQLTPPLPLPQTPHAVTPLAASTSLPPPPQRLPRVVLFDLHTTWCSSVSACVSVICLYDCLSVCLSLSLSLSPLMYVKIPCVSTPLPS